MHKHSSFTGFDQIRADEDLKEKLYSTTTEHLLGKGKKRSIGRPVGICVCAMLIMCVGGVIYRMSMGGPGESIPPISGVEPPIETSGGDLSQTRVSDEMFELMAYLPETGTPVKIDLNSVQVILPNTGPDYHTEIVDGVEAFVAAGFVSPDLSVSGEGIESITYTAENELLVYEDPRQWATEEGRPTWSSVYYLIPLENFKNPHAPTMEEIIRELEFLREAGELRSFEHQLLRIKWAEKFYEQQGALPANEDYQELQVSYENFVSQPLDYSQFLIRTETDLESGGVWVTLINPDNQIDTPILWEQSVTTRPGEMVAYSYTGETSDRMRVKGECDLTEIRDVITIEIQFASGNAQIIYLQVSHNADGVLTMQASDSI